MKWTKQTTLAGCFLFVLLVRFTCLLLLAVKLDQEKTRLPQIIKTQNLISMDLLLHTTPRKLVSSTSSRGLLTPSECNSVTKTTGLLEDKIRHTTNHKTFSAIKCNSSSNSDRFIPNRLGIDFDYCNHALHAGPEDENARSRGRVTDTLTPSLQKDSSSALTMLTSLRRKIVQFTVASKCFSIAPLFRVYLLNIPENRNQQLKNIVQITYQDLCHVP
jgi:hypothetical protein